MSQAASSTQIRFAGVGSQGLVSASVVLAQALGIVRDYEVVQTQFYAASIQGGASCGDVIFGREKIVFPWVLNPDVLVVLAQDAVKAHAKSMRPGSRVLCDAQLVTDLRAFGEGVTIYRAPLMALADSLRVRKCMNIVALGAFAQLTQTVTLQEMTNAVLARAPGQPDINRQAVKLGYEAPLELVDRTPVAA
ncbi:MAG TPA: 2-oxoacid:acceptor oxidoreductase family protein [Ramlibacter sp.]|uniref:2-oxoacid:acceptor oxidoreductase family protein n=1 Tax=Ramlibacter sp. TaxID=1917967 RepID=UPI002B6B839D|nr:2-oxoacid:acceptor oxidoreductase family protein [Ramlibacter sp.]HVZ42644.1 2-oxoacid:acceptor oxidoreductase family protein [Ramlibacter sp.]